MLVSFSKVFECLLVLLVLVLYEAYLKDGLVVVGIAHYLLIIASHCLDNAAHKIQIE